MNNVIWNIQWRPVLFNWSESILNGMHVGATFLYKLYWIVFWGFVGLTLIQSVGKMWIG